MRKSGFIEAVHEFFWKIKVYLMEKVRYIKNYSRIQENKKFKDIAKNKRCFIVGNGPSLLIEDLNTLQNNHEITFGSNKIYELFEDTLWRPSYFAVCDTTVYKNNKDAIDKLKLEKFLPLDIAEKNEHQKYLHLFSRVPIQIIRKRPRFSPDLTKHLSEGGTVTFFLMQIAVYMGFKELYLIGCDFNFSYGIDINGNFFEDPSVKDHFREYGDRQYTMPNLQYNYWAYQAAQRYAKKHGIKIFNATRGGKLEVYERVNFDSLFD